MPYNGPMIILLILTFVLSKNLSQGESFLMDKTFTHDNSYCRVSSDTFLEIEIRSKDQYTRMEDAEYGEYVIVKNKEEIRNVPMNNEGIGRYRLIKGSTPECSKVLSLSLGKAQMVVFLAKENRPFGDTLTLLYLDLRTLEQKVVNTEYRTKNEKIVNKNLEFQVAADLYEIKTESTVIDKTSYIYTQKDFEPIMTFDGKSFSVDTKKTYGFYNNHLFFKTEQEFFKAKGDSKTVFRAMSSNHDRKCFSFDGQFWRCL